MGLSLELRPELKTEQTLRAEQRLGLKAELKLGQSLSLNIGEMRGKIIAPDLEILQQVLDSNIDNIPNQELNKGMKALFVDPLLRERLIKNKEDMAVPTERKIKRLVADYLYDTFSGEFGLGKEDASGNWVEESVLKINKNAFSQTCFDQQKQKDELTKMIEIARSMQRKGEDTEGTFMAIKELEDAIRVHGMLKDQIELLKNSVSVALNLKNSEGQPEVRDFFRELIIMNKLNRSVSVRMLRRFAAKFSRINKLSKPEQFETAFVNTIGEYALVSMGIIAPEIFSLYKAELDRELREDLRKDFGNQEANIEQILDHFQTEKRGMLFWNRWKTLGVKPNIITDNLIRDFITATVRKDKDEILEIYDYPQIFEKAKQMVCEGGRNILERQDCKLGLEELLVDAVRDTDNGGKLLALAKNRWYEKLDIFYAQQNDEEKAA